MGHPTNFFLLKGVRENEDVFDRDEPFEPGNGLIEQSSVIEQIEELFGFGVSAEGPETSAASTGENEGIVRAHGRDLNGSAK